MLVSIAKMLVSIIEWVVTLPSKKSVFFNTKEFAWTSDLEANSNKIADEAKSLLLHIEQIPLFRDLSVEQNQITENDDWRTYMLMIYGKEIEKNTALCPETTRLVKSIPGMRSALFSIMKPGIIVKPHRGMYRGILRYHLGLLIPKDFENCAIKVDGITYHWKKGESVIFDDTYIHEVWNKTDEYRVVLFVDIERPLIFPFNLANQLILNSIKRFPYIQKIVKNVEDHK